MPLQRDPLRLAGVACVASTQEMTEKVVALIVLPVSVHENWF